MARCGCSDGCACVVTAGPGIAVTGTGQPSNGYVISADLSGLCGTIRGCISVGGLLHYDTVTGEFSLTCADVRGCITAGAGTSYDPATGVISIKFSTDPGNIVVAGSDGGVFATVDCADVRACLTAVAPSTFDTPTGAIGTKLSADAGNATTTGGDGGLFTPGISTDAGNALTSGTDGGLFDPATTVGCGLQFSGTDIVVNTGNPTWGFPCAEVNGGNVYCDPATGRLLVDPKHFNIAENHYSNVLAGHHQLTEFGAPGSGSHPIGPPMVYTVNNPSPCRAMRVIASVGIAHMEFSTHNGGYGNAEFDVRGDITGSVTDFIGGHQRWAATAGASVSDTRDVSSSWYRAILIPAGGSVTISVQASIILVAQTGDAEIGDLQIRSIFQGETI